MRHWARPEPQQRRGPAGVQSGQQPPGTPQSWRTVSGRVMATACPFTVDGADGLRVTWKHNTVEPDFGTAGDASPGVPKGAYPLAVLQSVAEAAAFPLTVRYWESVPPDRFATQGCPPVATVLNVPPASVLLVTTTPP